MVFREIAGFWRRFRRLLGLAMALLAAMAILLFPHYSPASANRCYALLIFTVIAWVTVALPLFTTALIIPLMIVLLQLMRDVNNNDALSPTETINRTLEAMFGGTVPVLLASFTIAACFMRYEVPFISNNRIVDRLGTSPAWLLLALMYFTLLLCIGMSNLSASILAYSLLSRRLTADHIPDQVAKALLMGIAVAGNIGGFVSPVSSTQNVFAYGLIQDLEQFGWGVWMKVTVPCAVLSVFGCWALIVMIYGLHGLRVRVEDKENLEAAVAAIGDNPQSKELPSSWKLIAIVTITIMTIVLWSTSSLTVDFFGGMATISFIPLILIFGLDILSPQDLRLLPWDLLLLIMGALALVAAARSSNLLTAMTDELSQILSHFHAWVQLAVICFVLLIMSTLKSHTVAGLIFIPVVTSYVSKVGVEDGMPLLMTAVMSTSIGMAFPFSGLVNLMLLAVLDGDGNRILSSLDFIKTGLPASVVTYLVVITIGPLFC